MAVSGARPPVVQARAQRHDGQVSVTVDHGATRVWERDNQQQSMPHPMQQHGRAFRVLGRTGSPEQLERLAVDPQDRTVTDLGRKDTVLG